jgi:hypothetical protein
MFKAFERFMLCIQAWLPLYAIIENNSFSLVQVLFSRFLRISSFILRLVSWLRSFNVTTHQQEALSRPVSNTQSDSVTFSYQAPEEDQHKVVTGQHNVTN